MMVDVERAIMVRNPRTGEHDYKIVPPSEAEFAARCTSLRAHQKAWSEGGIGHRTAVMRRWAAAILENQSEIAAAEAVDTARTRLSHLVPKMVAGGILDWCDKASDIIAGAHLSGHSKVWPNVHFETQLKPYPLLGVISPWNHPFLLATLDAIPALLAGCAVIIKPSEIAPRFIEPVMKTVAMVEELAQVLTFVPGDGRTGQTLIANVDAVCFTGSIPTGRLVAEACARRFIPAFLELGGKDAVIVTATADVERAVTSVVRGSNDCTGQLCFATERVYVDEKIYEPFVRELVRQSEDLALTFPDAASGHIGPFILEKQAAIIDAQLDEAVAMGARILTGGKSERLGGGAYMRPTVVVNVNHEMSLMRDETFGPVTPVMPYATIDEGVALANDSMFGLSGAVIAGDEAEALQVGRQLDAGAISLQDTSLTIAIMQDAEKTAFQSSGLGGSRMGPNSLLRFFRKKVLMTNETAPVDMRTLTEGIATNA
jgi:succinate-semialdehyde dehydrogenase/glutarate-semialdehyde dehydrogenase